MQKDICTFGVALPTIDLRPRISLLLFRFRSAVVVGEDANNGITFGVSIEGFSAEKDLEVGGGSVGIESYFVFDAKSMSIKGFSSKMVDHQDIRYQQVSSSMIPFSTFTKSNLKVVAFVSINWTNPNCNGVNNNCGTGLILEQK